MKIPAQHLCMMSLALVAVVSSGCGTDADDASLGMLQSQSQVNNLRVGPLLRPGAVGLQLTWTGDSPVHWYQYQFRPTGGSWSGDYTIFEEGYLQPVPTQTTWRAALVDGILPAGGSIECDRWYEVRVHGPYGTWHSATGYSTPCSLGPGTLVRLRHASDSQCLYAGLNTDMNHWNCWEDSNMRFYVEQVGVTSVRLRHTLTNRCISNSSQNGAPVPHEPCQTLSPSFLYTLEPAAPGLVRLRNQLSGKSLYTAGGNGGTVHSWDTWDDPNMRFGLDPVVL